METRILPHAEWPSLAGTDLDPAWRYLSPDRNTVLVAESGGRVVGHVVVMRAVHAEFFWIDPAHRGKVSVFRRLRDRLRSVAEAEDAPTIWLSAISEQMKTMIPKIGAELVPGIHGVWTIKEPTWQQP